MPYSLSMIDHPKMIQFDNQMKAMLDAVDNYIEDKYGDLYPLHPVRPKRNETANPQADGLFSVRADFTPGYGSELGRGYILKVEMKTLSDIPDDVRQTIFSDAVEKFRQLLPVYFPERKLEIKQDKDFFKIVGDFSLGTA